MIFQKNFSKFLIFSDLFKMSNTIHAISMLRANSYFQISWSQDFHESIVCQFWKRFRNYNINEFYCTNN